MADFDFDSLEEIEINLEMEDGETVSCQVHTIFEYDGKDYAALIPSDAKEEDEEVEVYFFGFEAKGKGENIDISLEVIEDDNLLEELATAFSEMMAAQGEEDEEEADEEAEDEDSKWDEFIHKKLEDI